MSTVITGSDEQFTLEDRYRREAGTVYLTGIQALVRMLLDRARAERRAGRDTAIYVTGYEGSPLGGFDLELARHAALLAGHGVTAAPGLNEELAATAVSGTQLARSIGGLRPAGVTGVWYGKTPAWTGHRTRCGTRTSSAPIRSAARSRWSATIPGRSRPRSRAPRSWRSPTWGCLPSPRPTRPRSWSTGCTRWSCRGPAACGRP